MSRCGNCASGAKKIAANEEFGTGASRIFWRETRQYWQYGREWYFPCSQIHAHKKVTDNHRGRTHCPSWKQLQPGGRYEYNIRRSFSQRRARLAPSPGGTFCVYYVL